MPIATGNSTPSRRRFSIRPPRPLWIGLVAVLLVVVAGALRFGLPIVRQQAAKKALERRGADIESEYHGPEWLGQRPSGIDGRGEEWERNPLRMLFYDVTFVSLSNYRNGYEDFQFGDRDVPLLRAFPKLKRADLSDSDITDAGLAYLGGLNHLESLDLSGTKIGAVGLAHLSRLPALRLLRLFDVKLTDADLVVLTRLKRLRALSLGSEGITDAGLKQIAAISTLERLELRDPVEATASTEPAITNAGLEHLKGMKNLRSVYFNTWGITDAGIDSLRRALPGLKVLTVNDEGLYEE